MVQQFDMPGVIKIVYLQYVFSFCNPLFGHYCCPGLFIYSIIFITDKAWNYLVNLVV